MGDFNGSGTFVRTYNWQNDADASIDIEASRMDTEDDGFAVGLSTCITKDGQTVIEANLPMAGFRHTGVGNASARTHYGVTGQIQDGAYTVGSSVSGADTIAMGVTPAITAYAAGQVFRFLAAANNTGAVTLNVDSVGAVAIKKLNGTTALSAGDIVSGQAVTVFYDGTNFQLISPSAVAPVELSGNNTWTGTNTFTGTVAMTSKAFNAAKGGDIASATTTDIGAATGNAVDVTGTTTITGLGTVQAGTTRTVRFTGILILTHNGTSLILPTGADITTAAGDVAVFVSLGSGNWYCADYSRADGTPLAGSLTAATQADQETGTSTTTYVSPGRQQFHASACKAWVSFTSVTTTAIIGSYNITSLTDNGTGRTTITIATDFSGATYCPVGMCYQQTSSSQFDGLSIDNGSTVGAGTLDVVTTNAATGNDADNQYTCVAMFGDQA